MSEVQIEKSRVPLALLAVAFSLGISAGTIIQEFRVQQEKQNVVEARLGKYIERMPDIARIQVELAFCRAGMEIP